MSEQKETNKIGFKMIGWAIALLIGYGLYCVSQFGFSKLFGM